MTERSSAEAAAAAFAREQELWPGVTVDASAFAEALRKRLPEALPEADQLLAIQALHATDRGAGDSHDRPELS